MKVWMMAAAAVLVAGTATYGQESTAVVVNRESAKWTHEATDPPGSESVFLRDDAKTGGMELLVSFAGGHTFAPHYHESNERMILLEGRVSLKVGKGAEQFLEAGGFAFLPAREVQRLQCVSKTKCVFYLAWDGKPKSYAAKE
jgi:quercetin dioxygenase-like cupin family protein